jgi:protein-tyrosine phosphatase
MRSSGPDPFRVLFVCTGNICRSPMGQAMLTHRLREQLGDDADDVVEVRSAGTYGLVGHPIEPNALTVLGELGVTPDPFESRELVKDLLDETGLVLTATREHRGAAVSMLPRASRRTFTLREFARLVAAADLAHVTGDGPAERGRSLVEAAAMQRGYVRPDSPADDDIADPYRRPLDAFRSAAHEIDTATSVIAAKLATALA